MTDFLGWPVAHIIIVVYAAYKYTRRRVALRTPPPKSSPSPLKPQPRRDTYTQLTQLSGSAAAMCAHSHALGDDCYVIIYYSIKRGGGQRLCICTRRARGCCDVAAAAPAGHGVRRLERRHHCHRIITLEGEFGKETKWNKNDNNIIIVL